MFRALGPAAGSDSTTARASVPPAVAARLSAFARGRRLTVNTLVQAAWAILLSRYQGRADVVFGVTHSGRPADLDGVESMVGVFINTLALPLEVGPSAPLAGWLFEVQARLSELRQFEHTPLAQALEWSGLGSRVPFETVVVFENFLVPEQQEMQVADGELSFGEPASVGAQTVFPLALIAAPEGEALSLLVRYDRRQLDEAAAARLLGHLISLLEAMPAHAEEPLAALLDRIPTAEIAQVVPPAEVRPAYVAPRTEVERRLVELCAGLFGDEQIGAHDSFLGLGGHSLIAVQLLARIREVFGVELTLGQLLDASTLGEIAARIESSQAVARLPPLAREARPARVPLSFGQRALLSFGQVPPEDPFYRVNRAVHLVGPLDRAAVERTVEELARRHEILRTSFPFDDRGERYQRIAPSAPPLRMVDLSSLEASERNQAALRTCRQHADEPFSVEEGPLFDALLVRLAPEEHLFMLSLHHVLFDEVSNGILLEELGALYSAFSTGRPSPLAEVPFQYADFTLWERGLFAGAELERQLGYWRARLDGYRPMRFPGGERDSSRPLGNAAEFFGRLPRSIHDGLQSLCAQERATSAMVALAAFHLVLARLTGTRDVASAAIFSVRTHEVAATMGPLCTMLCLRTDLAGATSFRAVLQKVRATMIEAVAHQHVASALALPTGRDLGREPLYQVLFHMVSVADGRGGLELRGLETQPLPVPRKTIKLDLELHVGEDPDGLFGRVNYSTDRFSAATVARLWQEYGRSIERGCAEPDRPFSADEI
jgi:non-ribosomal peptide synthetase component F